MTSPSVRTIKLFVFAYTFLCLVAYYCKGDYYHKQNDQFAYLAFADNLRIQGMMKDRIDFLGRPSRTLTTGASLVMLPFSKMRVDHVFFCVSFLYFLLNLYSIVPLSRLLSYFKIPDKQIFWILLTYFTSFPITMFKLWPMNEGPSLFLVSWFLYYIFVEPRSKKYFPVALVAPIFRVHIFFVEIAAALFALVCRNWALLKKSVFSLGVSSLGFAAYGLLFPADQSRLGQNVFGAKDLQYLKDYLQANAHLFIPETVSQFLLHQRDADVMTLAGALIVLAVVSCVAVSLLKKRVESKAVVFGFFVILVSSVGVCLSLAIIARFHTVAFLWILLSLIVLVGSISPRAAKDLALIILVVNLGFLVAYLVAPSTDAQYEELESLKRLSTRVGDEPVVYVDKGFPINGRMVYAYFRRPSGEATTLPRDQKAMILSYHVETYREQLKGCSQDVAREGAISLLHFDCRGGTER